MNTTMITSVATGTQASTPGLGSDSVRAAANIVNIANKTAPGIPVADVRAAVSQLDVSSKSLAQQKLDEEKDKNKPGAASQQAISESIKQINDYMQANRRELQFVLDKDSGKQVVKIVDSDTSEVIRQFPSEEVIALSRALQQGGGFIVKEKA